MTTHTTSRPSRTHPGRTHHPLQRPALLEQITGSLLGLATAEACAGTYGHQPSDRTTTQVLAITRAYEAATALTDAHDSGCFTGPINAGELITAATRGSTLEQRGDGGRDSTIAAARALPCGLVRPDAALRATEASRAADAPHPHAPCRQAAIAYAALLAAILAGHSPASAIDVVQHDRTLSPEAREAVVLGAHAELASLDTSARPLPALSVAVWALRQTGSFLEILAEVTSTVGTSAARAAMVGGVLGARDGDEAIPTPWTSELEHTATTIRAVAADLTWLHCHQSTWSA